MEYRQLGNTGLKVSAIGLGTEYLKGKSRPIVEEVIHTAVAGGVNYIDLVFSFPEILDNLSAALQGQRDQVYLAAHLGSTEKDGQYKKTRAIRPSKNTFLDLLDRLGTDHVDVLHLHNCDSPKDYDKLMRPEGFLGLARQFKAEGKARFIGFSSHTVSTALRAVESGEIDVLMFPVNIASNAVSGKKELLQACAACGIGVIAMKPYAGGKLLTETRTVNVARYQMGGQSLKIQKNQPITPVQCLAYVLSQVGVSTAVPGCQDAAQMQAALAYTAASEQAKDFAAVLADFEQYVSGECVYCNHCLPCPAVIDIGHTIRLLDAAGNGITGALRPAYKALPAPASACTECGACEQRCPFGVDIIVKLQQAVTLFEG